jgi:hypothetical protein
VNFVHLHRRTVLSLVLLLAACSSGNPAPEEALGEMLEALAREDRARFERTLSSESQSLLEPLFREIPEAFQALCAMGRQGLEVVEKEIVADSATLTLKLGDARLRQRFVMEDGEWKLDLSMRRGEIQRGLRDRPPAPPLPSPSKD